MKNLLYSLPEDLQEKIVKMNPHPLHKIFNDEIKNHYNLRYEYNTSKLWYKLFLCHSEYYCNYIKICQCSNDCCNNSINCSCRKSIKFNFDIERIRYTEESLR